MTGNGDFTKRVYFRGVEKVVPTPALRNSPAHTYAIENRRPMSLLPQARQVTR